MEKGSTIQSSAQQAACTPTEHATFATHKQKPLKNSHKQCNNKKHQIKTLA
jgi:thiol:disulfide interchange protein